MDEKALAAWSVAQNYKKSTTSTRLSDIRAIEKVYGDLEILYAQDKLEGLLKELAYSSKDKAANRPNPSKLPLWGDTYRDLSHLRATVNFYRRFRSGAARQTRIVSLPDIAAVEAAMAEYLDLGPFEFMDRYGQAWDDVSVYLLKDGQFLPARAIIAVAGQYAADAILPEDSVVDEQLARKHLDALGLVTAELPPVLLFAKDGQYFAPVRTKNRSTGAIAFTYRPPGANNERAQAIEVGDWAGIARALLVDGRAVRIQPWLGKGENYLTYPGQNFSDVWLRPDIADSLGMAPSAPRALSTTKPKQVEPRATMTQSPTNLILFGPPGTGKTWSTAEEAVRLCDGETPADRDALMLRYRALVAAKRIAFVTFHQSIDYEAFVEGLRPETDPAETGGAGFSLLPKPGVFREICALANDARTRTRATEADEVGLEGRNFWKMSLGAAGSEDHICQAALDGNYIVMGWGGDVDWSSPRFDVSSEIRKEWLSSPRESDRPSNYSQLAAFRNDLKVGDVVIASSGRSAFKAIGVVEGDYFYEPTANGDYCHRRPVKWLLKLDEPLSVDTITDRDFGMRTIHFIANDRINFSALSRLIGGGADRPIDGHPDQFVLIIDEINRANVSKVFGELITLIEPDKRLGQDNALEVTLPHSRKPFGVPDNLHLLGTMNTADRSIALLDTALRRRFQFKEMPPRPQALEKAANHSGLPVIEALQAMNDRIEYLLDRDHRIGHAYLVGCRTKDEVHAAFREKIIPLLQEYFFEDWSKVAAILNEKPSASNEGKGAFLEWRQLYDPTGSGGPVRTSWAVRATFAENAVEQLARTQPLSSSALIVEDVAETTAEAQ